jgi:hypothetical protein
LGGAAVDGPIVSDSRLGQTRRLARLLVNPGQWQDGWAERDTAIAISDMFDEPSAATGSRRKVALCIRGGVRAEVKAWETYEDVAIYILNRLQRRHYHEVTGRLVAAAEAAVHEQRLRTSNPVSLQLRGC